MSNHETFCETTPRPPGSRVWLRRQAKTAAAVRPCWPLLFFMGFCIFLLTVGLRAAPTVMRLPGPAVASGVGGSPGFPTPTERPGPGGPGQADLPEPHAEARAGVQPAARHSGGESRSPDRLSSESKSRSAHVRARAHKRATTSARPPADHGGCSHRSASSEQGNRAGTRVFGFSICGANGRPSLSLPLFHHGAAQKDTFTKSLARDWGALSRFFFLKIFLKNIFNWAATPRPARPPLRSGGGACCARGARGAPLATQRAL